MGWYQYVMAALYDPFMRTLEGDLYPYRRRLLGRAKGHVLEVGAGTGVNFPLYPASVQVDAIEPSRAMYLKALRKQPPPHIRLLHMGIEDTRLDRLAPPGGYDYIVSMLVLCSVKDLDGAIQRYRQLLKPDGKLLVLEHIHSTGTAYGRFQQLVNPVWKPLADGCNLTRRQDLALKPYFRPEEEGTFRLGTDWYWAIMRKK